ncbi:MAG: hypothetical protein JXA37_11375 [Chloroflexia bacterium]|nr:hypothetical protein [Chloroflexia bacterium]
MSDVLALQDKKLKQAVVKMVIERSAREGRIVRESEILRDALRAYEPLAEYLSDDNGMRCPECGGPHVKEVDNLHSVWACQECGYQGDGSEFAGSKGDN